MQTIRIFRSKICGQTLKTLKTFARPVVFVLFFIVCVYAYFCVSASFIKATLRPSTRQIKCVRFFFSLFNLSPKQQRSSRKRQGRQFTVFESFGLHKSCVRRSSLNLLKWRFYKKSIKFMSRANKS